MVYYGYGIENVHIAVAIEIGSLNIKTIIGTIKIILNHGNSVEDINFARVVHIAENIRDEIQHYWAAWQALYALRLKGY